MTPLFQAVFTRFNSTEGAALKTALGGRLYNTGAPQGATFPLATVSLVSNTTDQLVEKCLVQFSVFSSASSMSEVGTIYALLTALFDNCDLANLGTPDNLGMERSFSQLFHEDNVWHYVIEYECWVLRR